MSVASRSTVFILLLSVITHSQSEKSLQQILGQVSNKIKPLVVYIDAGQKNGRFNDLLASDGDERIIHTAGQTSFSDEDDDEDKTSEDQAKDEAKYLLYNFLRTSPENLDPQLEERKQILRQALRARCNQVSICIKTCSYTEEKPSKCPKKCKRKLDEDDLCGPPKCKKCGRGKTMPPKWMLF